MSLLETLATLAAILVATTALYDVLTNQRIWEASIDKNLILQNVMEQNLLEVRSRTFDKLVSGHCVIRNYDSSGALKGETELGTACGPPSLATGELFKVTWNIKLITDADIKVDPTVKLPMPKYYDAVKVVTIQGVAKTGDQVIVLRLSTYKR
jgi:hypothetical protein